MQAKSQRVHFFLCVEQPRIGAEGVTDTLPLPVLRACVTLYVDEVGGRTVYTPRTGDEARALPDSAMRLGTLTAAADDVVQWTSVAGDSQSLRPGEPIPGRTDIFIGPAPPTYVRSTAARLRLDRDGANVELESTPVTGRPFHRFALQTFRLASWTENDDAAAARAEGAAAFARSRSARLPTIDELEMLYDGYPDTRLTAPYPWEWAYDTKSNCIRAIGNGGALNPRSHQRPPNDSGLAYFRLAYDIPWAPTTEPSVQRRTIVAVSAEALAGRRPLATFRDVGRSGTWLLFDDRGQTEVAFVDRLEMRTVGVVESGAVGGTVLDAGDVVIFFPNRLLNLTTGQTLRIADVRNMWGPHPNSIIVKTSAALLQYDGAALLTLSTLEQGRDGIGHPNSGWVVWRWDGSFRYDCTFGEAGVQSRGTRGAIGFDVSDGALREREAGNAVDAFIATDGTTSSLRVGRRSLVIRHRDTRAEIDLANVTVARMKEILQLRLSAQMLMKTIPFRLGGDGRIWHVDNGQLFTDVEEVAL